MTDRAGQWSTRAGRALVTDPAEVTPVPFVDMRAVNGPVIDEIHRVVGDVIERGDFIMGDAVRLLEEAFSAYIGTDHAIGVDSGFSALELLLRAHEIGPGDEVITVANTFFATVMAIKASGATPVLVDSDAHTHLIDPAEVEAAITPRTKAILPVHLYGRIADMDSLNTIARRHGLVVIEDACQAHGAGPIGARAGSLADGAAFSFYPSKNLGGVGDGGMVTIDDPEIARRIRMLRNLGTIERYRHEIPGYNRRLDTLQAAVLSVKLQGLDAANADRRTTAGVYRDLLAEAPLTLPEIDSSHVFHLYVVEVADRDGLAEHLENQSIATGIHYPVPIHLQPAFAEFGWQKGDFPRAERSAGRILSLPMYPRMIPRDTVRVAEATCRFFN